MAKSNLFKIFIFFLLLRLANSTTFAANTATNRPKLNEALPQKREMCCKCKSQTNKDKYDKIRSIVFIYWIIQWIVLIPCWRLHEWSSLLALQRQQRH